MKYGKRVFVVAVAALAGATWSFLVACSSSDTTDTAVPTVDAAHPTTDSASPGVDSATPEGDAGTGDAASECGTPATLHPVTAGGDGGNIYCPFSAVDGGKTQYCTTDEQCCETPSGGSPSTCEAKASTCPVTGSTIWECEDPTDCAASGMQCCASSTTTAVTVATDTCGPYLSHFAGTHCAATCATGELVVCEAQAACTTGTCTAVKPKGNSLGVCN